MKKHRVSKKLVAIVMCGALLVPVGAMAGEVNVSSNETVSLADYENYIKSRDGIATRSANNNLSVQAFDYMEASVAESDLNNILDEYHDVAGTREKTYEMFGANLDGIYQEVEANDFNEEQAAQLLKSAADLETGNAEVTEFTPVDSDELPVPSHSDATTDTSKPTISLLSNSDISARHPDESGLGYEVQSKPGYNKTTADCYPGTCNIGDIPGYSGGIAAYMIYTISNGYGAQDIGIQYYSDGKWCPYIWGTWTDHAIGPARVDSGHRIYLKIWIDTQNQICFQGIDASDFSTILFQNAYPTWNQVPYSGSGVTINRQITYAANEKYRYDHSGYYLNNARYDRAYLYNTSSAAMFTDGNTTSHRGKFSSSWAPISNVTINSNTHWYSETVSIDMT